MNIERTECCAGCGSCSGVEPGVYYWGRKLSVRERSAGGCCHRTRQTTTAYEVEGRDSEGVCSRCVLRRRLLLLASALPCLALMGLALAEPGLVPAQGPLRLGFFLLLAATLFPVWICGRRAFSRAGRLRDEIAAGHARRRLPDRVLLTRMEYRRMGGVDRGAP